MAAVLNLAQLDTSLKLSILDFCDERPRIAVDSLVDGITQEQACCSLDGDGVLVNDFTELLSDENRLKSFLNKIEKKSENPPYFVGKSFSSALNTRTEAPCLKNVAREASKLFSDGELKLAHMGSGKRETGWQAASVRGDKVTWLHLNEGHSAPNRLPNAAMVVERIEELRKALNRAMGEEDYLVDFETQLACYPGKARYAPHFDAASGSHSRRHVTIVIYLNDGWTAENGGELHLRLKDSIFTLQPKIDRFVVFPSALLEHEIRESTVPRYAIAAWFRRKS